MAPLYADVDTRGVGEVYFRMTSTDIMIMQQIDSLIHDVCVPEGGFTSTSVTIATWENVGHYDSATTLVS